MGSSSNCLCLGMFSKQTEKVRVQMRLAKGFYVLLIVTCSAIEEAPMILCVLCLGLNVVYCVFGCTCEEGYVMGEFN